MGIQHAKRRGVKLGRPALTRLTNDVASMREQRATGVTFRELAKEFGTSVWTVHKLCSKPSGRDYRRTNNRRLGGNHVKRLPKATKGGRSHVPKPTERAESEQVC